MSVAGQILMCRCLCHQEALGNYREARHWERWHQAIILSNSPIINITVPVDARDPVEAAVAQGCSCLHTHAIALTVKNPWDLFGTPWTPEKDADPQTDDDGTGNL